MNALNITKSYKLPYSVDQVFSAWISNEFSVTPVKEVFVEPRVGGIFRLTTGSGSAEGIMQGRILAFEPSRRLMYTWRWGDDGPASTVEVYSRMR